MWGLRSVDDELLRVLFLSFVKLIQHRFGSHVVQTLLTLGAKTIDREVSPSRFSSLLWFVIDPNPSSDPDRSAAGSLLNKRGPRPRKESFPSSLSSSARSLQRYCLLYLFSSNRPSPRIPFEFSSYFSAVAPSLPPTPRRRPRPLPSDPSGQRSTQRRTRTSSPSSRMRGRRRARKAFLCRSP